MTVDVPTTRRRPRPTVADTQHMAELLAGFQQSQALHAFGELGLANALLDGPLPVADLAAATGTDPDALTRLLRFLSALDVVAYDDAQVFALTPLGATLADGPGSVRALARFWMDTHYHPFSDLVTTVRTGEPAFQAHFGQTIGAWLDAHPEHLTSLIGAMSDVALSIKVDVLAGYALPPGEIVADIGGADGTVLAGLLDRPDQGRRGAPRRRGIVLDVPAAVAPATARLAALGLADRVEAVGGNFFEEVPAADVYILSTVLHDWDDDQCATLLGTIAKAARPRAHLVVVEAVLPDTDASHPAKFNDLAMLGVGTGRERSRAEYGRLLGAAGFTETRLIPGPSYNPFSILEARLEG
ncbi:methyltransferase [Streptomyces sp. NPDC004610]|uniref:methyltransferase n=1 Tax=unclassified Streptomyces TaxID=2593676 RepID=UPI0033BE8F69